MSRMDVFEKVETKELSSDADHVLVQMIKKSLRMKTSS